MPGPIEQTFLEMCMVAICLHVLMLTLPAPHGLKNSARIKPEGSHLVTASFRAWEAASSRLLCPLALVSTPCGRCQTYSGHSCFSIVLSLFPMFPFLLAFSLRSPFLGLWKKVRIGFPRVLSMGRGFPRKQVLMYDCLSYWPMK